MLARAAGCQEGLLTSPPPCTQVPNAGSVELPLKQLGLGASAGAYWDSRFFLFYIKLQQPDPVGFLLEVAKQLLPDPVKAALTKYMGGNSVFNREEASMTTQVRVCVSGVVYTPV